MPETQMLLHLFMVPHTAHCYPHYHLHTMVAKQLMVINVHVS